MTPRRTLALLTILAACTSQPTTALAPREDASHAAPPPTPPAPPAPPPPSAEPNATAPLEARRCPAGPAESAEKPLPGGLYWGAGLVDYLYDLREAWPEPSAAIYAGIFPDARGAERAARALPIASIPPGYPLVADLGSRGLAVIVGAFETCAGASAWIAAHPEASGGLIAVDLNAKEAPKARDQAPAQQGTEKTEVVQIDPRRAAAAYAPSDAEAISDALHSSEIDYRRFPAEVERRAKALKPLCTVPAGAVFTFLNPGDGSGGALYEHRRLWAPVECGGQRAYVPWTATMLESVVERRPDGTYQLTQVTLVECDVAHVHRFRYGKNGREGPPVPGPRGPGCG